jgi:hypothetical protein
MDKEQSLIDLLNSNRGTINKKTRLSMVWNGEFEYQLFISNICAKIGSESQNPTSPGLYKPSIAGPGLNE